MGGTISTRGSAAPHRAISATSDTAASANSTSVAAAAVSRSTEWVMGSSPLAGRPGSPVPAVSGLVEGGEDSEPTGRHGECAHQNQSHHPPHPGRCLPRAGAGGGGVDSHGAG
jgi:hypothetical protein